MTQGSVESSFRLEPSRPVSALRWLGERRAQLLTALVIAIVAFLVLVPLAMLLWSSVRSGRPGLPGGTFTFSNYKNAYGSLNTYITIGRSFYFSGAVTAYSLLIGGLFAWLIERTNMPGRKISYSLMLSPMAIPRMLFGIAWVLLLSSRIGLINKATEQLFGFQVLNIYSMAGMILAQTLLEVPTAFLMVLGTLRSMDPSLEEAAYVSGSNNLSTLYRVTLPLMAPSLLAAAIYLFVVNIEVFEIPGIIGLPAGIKLFSTAIYTSATVSVPPNYGLANTYAVTFLVVSAVLIICYERATRHSARYSTITGKGFRPKLIDLGRWKYAASTVFFLFFLVTILLPVIVLLYSSLMPFYEVPSATALSKLSFANYIRLAKAPWLGRVLTNTFIVMVAAPSLCVFLAALIAWTVHRTRISPRWKRLVDILSFLPSAFPSIVIALAVLLLSLNLKVIPLYGTVWIIVLAFIIRYLPNATRTISAAVIQVHKELEESAQVCKATELASFLSITLPLIAPSFINAWIWVAMQSTRALSAALILFSATNEVLSTRIWEMWSGGDITAVSALAVIMTLMLLGISTVGRVAASRLSKR